MTNTTKSTTPALVDEYQRALARARKAGLKILGRGHLRDADRTPIVCVSSARLPNQYHVVAIGRDRLWCDCQAGLRGKFCMHRALTHELLLCAWRKERDRREAEEEAKLHEALRELVACHQVIDGWLRTMRTTAGNAPTVSQREAGVLLAKSTSASTFRTPARPSVPDVAREPIRGYSDTRAFSIFK